MAKHDVLNVSYMRKDAQFLADGIWYVTTPCPKCGVVDEEVPWTQAKTPHHAGLIADARHTKCHLELDAELQKVYAEQEIVAAETLRKDQARNVERARERLDALTAALPEGPARERELLAARELLVRHERGLQHAIRRVADTTAANRK